MGIISDLFSIARIRAKMQVRKLQTAEIKGAQIRERIKKEAEILRQQRIDTLKDLKLFEIGIAQAKALESANIQIVGGSGTDGGLSLGGMLTGLVATDAGKAIVERVAGKSI